MSSRTKPEPQLSFRKLEKKDFPLIVRWSRDPEIAYYMDGGYPQTLSECHQWYKNEIMGNPNRRFFMIVLDLKPIGNVELDHISWRPGEAELRIRIGRKQYWNLGYGTAAVRAILHWAFTKTRLHRIYLRVYSFNHRALRCYEKNGFRKQGILTTISDRNDVRKEIILMGITREQFLRQFAHREIARKASTQL